MGLPLLILARKNNFGVLLAFTILQPMSEKLEYKPSKLHPLVLKKIDSDVSKGVFVNFNTALNEILMLHYKIEFAKKKRLKDLLVGESFVFVSNQVSEDKTWELLSGCKDMKRLCKSGDKEEFKDCNAIVLKINQ